MYKLFPVLTLFLFVGCKTAQPLPACCTQEEIQKPIEEDSDVNMEDIDLSWVGIYKGVVPCDTCEGMDVTLNLKEDENYRLEIDYIGADSSLVRDFVFTWNMRGDIVILIDEDRMEGLDRFQLAEDAVYFLVHNRERLSEADDFVEAYKLIKQ
jgi:uncharacterized lipoprotein NlpE involved in copper resistance